MLFGALRAPAAATVPSLKARAISTCRAAACRRVAGGDERRRDRRVGELHVGQVGAADGRADDARRLAVGQVARAEQLAHDHALPVPRQQGRGRDGAHVRGGHGRQGDVRVDGVGVEPLRRDRGQGGGQTLEVEARAQQEHVRAAGGQPAQARLLLVQAGDESGAGARRLAGADGAEGDGGGHGGGAQGGDGGLAQPALRSQVVGLGRIEGQHGVDGVRAAEGARSGSRGRRRRRRRPRRRRASPASRASERPTARTGRPARSKRRATSPPVCPLAPITVIISYLQWAIARRPVWAPFWG